MTADKYITKPSTDFWSRTHARKRAKQSKPKQTHTHSVTKCNSPCKVVWFLKTNVYFRGKDWKWNKVPTQQTNSMETTSFRCRCDVMTSLRHRNGVVARFSVCWARNLKYQANKIMPDLTRMCFILNLDTVTSTQTTQSSFEGKLLSRHTGLHRCCYGDDVASKWMRCCINAICLLM